MTREDTIHQIAAVVRSSHAAALAAVGWLALNRPTEELEALLEIVIETDLAWRPTGHYQAYAERFGRAPRPQSK
ncbi:MAG TPA: hypothetical protein VN663_03130 [Ramlibacter sp.]|nr:hypothetical protein [Ramlibacter sp.]